MISATDNAYHTSTYSYDGEGRRVKRNINGTETWQVFGFGGELIAEYSQNGSPANPQKEYGYRNGELLVTAEPGVAGSNTNGHVFQRAITVDHTKAPNTDQSNFPLLVNGTYSYLKTTANGGNVQNSNGYDVIFTSDANCATKLNHEVETYNASTGSVNYWLKVPNLSHATDTTLYMCYGNSSITTDQSNKTAVWDSNYKAVWHLPNGSTLNSNDSTANANNGTASNVSPATGQVDGGGSFNGSSAKVDAGNPANLDGFTSLTLSAWVKATTLQPGAGIVSKWGGIWNASWIMSLDAPASPRR